MWLGRGWGESKLGVGGAFLKGNLGDFPCAGRTPQGTYVPS